MSRRCSSLKAYADAEDRLLDLLSPQSQTSKIEVPGNNQEEQQDGSNTNIVDITLPSTLDPTTHSIVHYISSNTDVLSLISSDDFLGFSDVDDEVLDTEEFDCSVNGDIQQIDPNECIYGVQRRRKADKKDTTDGNSQIEENAIDNTSPKRQRLSENFEAVVDTEQSELVDEVPLPSQPPTTITSFELSDSMAQYYTDGETADDLAFAPSMSIESPIEHDVCEIIFGNAYAIQTIVGDTSHQQCIIYDNSVVENVASDVCIVDIDDVGACERNIPASETISNMSAVVPHETGIGSVIQPILAENTICIVKESSDDPDPRSEELINFNKYEIHAADGSRDTVCSLNENNSEYYMELGSTLAVAVQQGVIAFEETNADDNDTMANLEESDSVAFNVDDDDDCDINEQDGNFTNVMEQINSAQSAEWCEDNDTTPEPAKEITIEADVEPVQTALEEQEESSYFDPIQFGPTTEESTEHGNSPADWEYAPVETQDSLAKANSPNIDSENFNLAAQEQENQPLENYSDISNKKSDNSNLSFVSSADYNAAVFETKDKIKESLVENATDVYDEYTNVKCKPNVDNRTSPKDTSEGQSYNNTEAAVQLAPIPPDLTIAAKPQESITCPALAQDTKLTQKYANSTTTEFPNSSTSQRNCSDEDDDAALLSASSVAAQNRTPIVKNTLSNEGLDRKLATICRSNPQMTLYEKIENWNCETGSNLSEFEEVESFNTVPESQEEKQHANQINSPNIHDYHKIRDTLSKNIKKLHRNMFITAKRLDSGQHATNSFNFLRQRQVAQKQHGVKAPIMLTVSSPMGGPVSTSSTTSTADQPGCSGLHMYDNLLNVEDVDVCPRTIANVQMLTVHENSSESTLKPAQSSLFDINHRMLAPRKASTCTIETQTIFTKELSTSSTQLKPRGIRQETAATSTTDLNEEIGTTSAETSIAAVTAVTSFGTPSLPYEYQIPMQLHHTGEATASTTAYSDVMHNGTNYISYNTPMQTFECNVMPMPTGGMTVSGMPNASVEMQINADNSLFYEQHEFCNYLGLTGMATANAVAVAMQELANSSVARRSLRVRSQQQLDRMRSSSSQTRRKDKTLANTTGQQTVTTNSIRYDDKSSAEVGVERLSEGIATDSLTHTTPSTMMTPIMCAAETARIDVTQKKQVQREQHLHQLHNRESNDDDDLMNKPYKVPCLSKDQLEKAHKLYDYCYKEQQRQQCDEGPSCEEDKLPNAEISIIKPTISRGSLNMASVNITSQQLHERMQNCLKKSREAKPTIYIVQATNHNKHPITSTAVGGAADQRLSAPHPSLAGVSQDPPALSHTYINIKPKAKSPASSPTGKMSPKLGQSHYRIATTNFRDDTESDEDTIETANEDQVQQQQQHSKQKVKKSKLKIKNQRKNQKKKRIMQFKPPQDNYASTVRKAFNAANKSGNSRALYMNQSARALVTRSTSHLNSRQLRTRKISLMKSYVLTEDAFRSKRLVGGSAIRTNSNIISRSAGHGTKPRTSTAKANNKTSPGPEKLPVMEEMNAKRLTGSNSIQKTLKIATTGTAKLTRNISKRVATPNSALTTATVTATTNLKGTKKTTMNPRIMNPRLAAGQQRTATTKTSKQTPLTTKGKAVRSGARAQSLPAGISGSSPSPSIKKLVGAFRESAPNSSEGFDVGEMGTQNVPPIVPPISTQGKALFDTQDYFTNSALVPPPLFSGETRKKLRSMALTAATAVNSISSTTSQSPKPLPTLQLRNTEHKHLPTPAFIYPSPDSLANSALLHQREVAGHTQKLETASKTSNSQNSAVHTIKRLTEPSPSQSNPLSAKQGKVLYIYYEQELLIVVQEKLISFWKYSKIFSILQNQKSIVEKNMPSVELGNQNQRYSLGDPLSSDSDRQPHDTLAERQQRKQQQDWVHLGRARRVTNDIEIAAPYANRICVNNSTPVYIELRCRPLDHNRRDCKLLSTYVNIYYYNEEDLRPKMHSVHLDAVQGEANTIIYTTITDSRYFVMAWPQETLLGKTRTGLCKYSLTPSLDTLASIREFKHMKHELKYIECLGDDRLVAYSDSRVTIWDHRSGDTIMSYDLRMEMGQNLGTMYYPSIDIGQSSLLVLYQHIDNVDEACTELQIIACEVSATVPSHRVLQVHKIPKSQFDSVATAVNTGDHLIIQSRSDEEIWISAVDPRLLTVIAPQGTQRFYTRSRSQVIELTKKSLTVDNIANHMIKLATAKTDT